MSEKRFVVENDNNEVSIKDKVEDNYPFALAYEHIDDADNLIQEGLSLVGLLNEQQATINELQSIINHIKCEEDCFDYDYCCETVCSLYNEIKHLKEENEQLRRLFEEMKQPITINLTEEDEKELRKLLGLIDDE